MRDKSINLSEEKKTKRENMKKSISYHISNEKKQKLKKYQKTIVKLKKEIFYGFNNVCYEFINY